ncbi:MAG: hypothetical protein NVS3B21_32960 [Acidimicrobiales bacterium]
MNRSFRRLTKGVAVATSIVLAPVMVVGSPEAYATQGFSFARTAGSNRFATAAALAGAAFPQGASTVVVATGFTFSDALAGNYLAGLLNPASTGANRTGAPILLVTAHSVPTETSAALQNLKAKNVILLGQTNAIDQSVSDQLAASGYQVSRVGGATRYDTMQQINEISGAGLVTGEPGTAAGAGGAEVGLVGAKKTALLARGDNFPDALGAGPVAFHRHFPVVLTDPASLSPQALKVLKDDGIEQVIILGGTAAISSNVEQQVAAAGITTLYRANGTDRSDTSRLLADYAITNLGFANAQFTVASGDDAFIGADALASGPFSGQKDAPLLVTNTIGDAGRVTQFYAENYSAETSGSAVGGQVPLPDSTLAQIIRTTPQNTGRVALPQLVSATVVATYSPATANGTTTFAGTVVQFVFSESVQAATIKSSGFHVYAASGDKYNGSNTPAGFGGCFAPNTSSGPTGNCTAVVDPSNPNAVDVTFNQTAPSQPVPTPGGTSANLQTAAGAGALTLATVSGPQDGGGPAATTSNGPSPDGTAPLNGPTPGQVNAPQLVGVRRTSTTDQSGNVTYSVTYTFSQPIVATPSNAKAPLGSPGGLHLYLADGQELNCAAATVGASSTSTPTDSQITCSSYIQAALTTPTAATASQLGAATLGSADYATVKGTASTALGNLNPEGDIALS